MLGNWSFGDYFKEDAIVWAWELLTKTWGLPPERLWVTVFGGDEKDGLPADADAERIWIERAGIDPKRVLRFGRKDNFWEMGETGPCGPCTEIHIDRGQAGTNPLDGADRKIGVNAGNERFIELWNNVFMEFNRLDDGRLVKLPARASTRAWASSASSRCCKASARTTTPTCSRRSSRASSRSAAGATARPWSRPTSPSASSPTTCARSPARSRTAPRPRTRAAATCCAA
jgi:hypothetical protein